MRIHDFMRGSSVAMLIASGVTLTAQVQTGSLGGVVKAPNGTLVSGAVVTVNSPALFAPRAATSNEKGEWRMPLLPPGSYTVKVTKAGFVSGTSPEIRIGIGQNLRQDVTIKPDTAAATVEVVATEAQVDKSDTKTATNFSAEQLTSIPAVDRSFSGAADLAPGVVTGVGGSFVVRGGYEATTGYTVNNTQVRDDYQGTLTATYVIEDNIEDVQVVLSPMNARMGRGNGGMNVVTKSGGNDFHGSIRSVLNRTSWNAVNPNDFRDERNDVLNRTYQVALSGPIVKDRIWFSIGTILSPDQGIDRNLPIFGNPSTYNRAWVTGNAGIDAVTLAGPGNGYSITRFETGTPYVRTDTQTYFEGKITAGITTDHTVEVSFSSDDVQLKNRDPWAGGGAFARLAALGTQKSLTKTIGLSYRGVLASNLFVEARYNKLDSRTDFPNGDASYPDAVLMGMTNVNTNTLFPFLSQGGATPDRRNNRSGNLNLKGFFDAMGTHEVDAGLDYYSNIRGTSTKYGQNNRRVIFGGGAYGNGTSAYLFPVINFTTTSAFGQSGTLGLAPVYQFAVGNDGNNENTTSSIYVNDAWTVNSFWNVMLGFRYDDLKVKDTDGSTRAKSNFFSPRFQVKYDLKGDNAHVMSASFARFSGDFTTGFTRLFIKDARTWTYNVGWNANPVAPGTASDALRGVRFVDYANLVNPANYNMAAPYTFNNVSKGFEVDPNLKPTYSDEFTLGYRRNYKDGATVALTLVHKVFKNEWAIERAYPRSATDSNFLALANPAEIGFTNLTARYIQLTKVFNSNDLTREYNGLEMEWKNPINSTWSWGGNYTYSRLTGNNQGGDTSGTTFRDTAATSYFNNREQLLSLGRTNEDFSPEGALANNQSQRGRAWIQAKLPLGKGWISYAWTLRYDSGASYSLATNAPTQLASMGTVNGFTNTATRPTAYTQFYGGRGRFTENDTYRVDFKMAFQVPLIRGVQFMGDFSVNNLFNHQMQGNWDRTGYNASAGTNQFVMQDATVYGTAELGARGVTNHFISARTVSTSLGLKF